MRDQAKDHVELVDDDMLEPKTKIQWLSQKFKIDVII